MKTLRNQASKTAHRLDPRQNMWTRVGLLSLLLFVGQISFAFAQGTGIPILDQVLALIDDYKLGIAMVGLAVVAIAMLARPIAPEWSGNNRSSLTSMIIGGVLLTLLPTIAAAIVGG